MTIYIIKRLLWLIPTVIAVLALLFSLTYLLPGEPAEIILGPRATPDMVKQINEELGLNQPWPVSFWHYLNQVIRGDLGKSIFRDLPVLEMVVQVLPHTLALTICGMGIAVFFGIIIGLLAANYENTFIDKFLTLLSFITASTPTYVAGCILLIIFAVKFNILPVMGTGEGIGGYLLHLIGPSLALSVGWTGYIARLTRSSMLETLGDDFIATAKSFGLPRFYIIYKYALKKAIKPIIAVVGLGVGRLLGGAIFVEVIFTRPGIGRLTVDAIFERDLPLVRGGVLIAAVLFVVANLLADISYAIFDPRIQQE